MAEDRAGRMDKFVLKNISKIFKMKQRLNFLSKCCDLKIVPETLKVKPPQNNANQSKITWNNYVNLAKSTSIKNLKFAKNDAEVALTLEETNFQEFLQEVLDQSNNEENLRLSDFIKNSKTKICSVVLYCKRTCLHLEL